MSVATIVAYELGIALALGRPAIIVAFENQDLPFDLDLEPVRIKPQGDETAALGLALDQNLYGLQREPRRKLCPTVDKIFARAVSVEWRFPGPPIPRID